LLTEDPKKLLLEGRYPKVPVMIGVTNLEGGGKRPDIVVSRKKEYAAVNHIVLFYSVQCVMDTGIFEEN